MGSVLQIIVDNLLNRGPILERKHKENKSFSDLEKNVFERIPDFESLKLLRSYINKLTRCIQKIKLVNNYILLIIQGFHRILQTFPGNGLVRQGIRSEKVYCFPGFFKKSIWISSQ